MVFQSVSMFFVIVNSHEVGFFSFRVCFDLVWVFCFVLGFFPTHVVANNLLVETVCVK